tara:strand:+ start:243 stop:683 length:441 start_codon:yes stop_codon:yes gene_type:complete
MKFKSTKVIELGSTCFRQPTATSHCRFLHGYHLTAKFYFIRLTEKKLDNNNWVVDFGGLKELKKELRNIFDHKTIISRKDPELQIFKDLHTRGLIQLVILNEVSLERFAEHCLETALDYIPESTGCYKVEVFEHSKNSAIYELGGK